MSAAPAINIKPSALPACTTGAPSESGGWNQRLFFGSGTDRTDWQFQVRPRALVLGEPCVSGGNLAIPNLVQDLPSEGSYGEVGGVVTLCADNDATNCGSFKGYGTTVSTGVVNRLCFAFAGDNSPAQEIVLRVGTGPAGSGPTNSGGTVATMKSTYLAGTISCPAGSNAVSTYVCGTTCTSAVAPWEWRYGTTGTANSAWTGNMEYLPPLAFWGAEIGARMTLGNHGPETNDAQIFCSTTASGTVSTTLNVSGYDAFQDDYVPTFDPGDTGMEDPIWERTGQTNTGVSLATCAYLVRVTMTVCSYDADHVEVCDLVTWSATRYDNDTPYTDAPPVDSICEQFPANPNCLGILEPDIVCEIAYSDPGNPITVLGEFFGGLGPWAYCMIVPVGWDRSDAIQTRWENGNVGELQSALDAAIPSGIACGEVFDVNTSTIDLTITTCSMDLAPSWAKGIVAGAVILGLLALSVKRIMWAVGSRG